MVNSEATNSKEAAINNLNSFLKFIGKLYFFGSPLVWLRWAIINSSVQTPQVESLDRAITFAGLGLSFLAVATLSKGKWLRIELN